MTDPLAGVREALNRGECSSLFWPDEGKGCPVEVGQLFSLRSCGIEITRFERMRKDGKWFWRADFIRYARFSDKPYLLSKSGITSEPRYAVRAQDDPNPGTLDRPLSAEQESDAHRNAGPPPEPEGIAPEDVARLPSSLEAKQRYELERAEVRRAEVQAPLSERVRRLECAGADLSRQFARIEQGVRAAESKARRMAPKVPSDRAA